MSMDKAVLEIEEMEAEVGGTEKIRRAKAKVRLDGRDAALHHRLRRGNKTVAKARRWSRQQRDQ